MTKNDIFVVRRSAESVVTMPSGRRVRTLDRGTFERAVEAANNYIAERSTERERKADRSVVRREPA